MPTAAAQPSQGAEGVAVVATATDVAVMVEVSTVETVAAVVVADGMVILVKKAEVVEDTVEIETEDTGKSTKLCY